MDHWHALQAFEEDLMNIARTTLSSKLLNVEKDHFARLAVDAVLRLKVGLSLCGEALLSFNHASFTVAIAPIVRVRTCPLHCRGAATWTTSS